MTTAPAAAPLTKAALRLAGAAASAGIRSDRPFRDMAYDELLTTLDGFGATEDGLRASPRVRAMYGREHRRLALAWAYVAVTAENHREAWAEFWQSMLEPTWTYISVANMTNYRSEIGPLALTDGITIRSRHRQELSDLLQWTPDQLDKTIGADWMASGSSEYVLVVSTNVPKRPENIVLSNTGEGAVLTARAMMALRLSGEGDIGIGTLFTTRVGGPPVLLMGLSSMPSPIRFAAGSDFIMTEARARSAKKILSQLAELDSEPAESYPELRSALDRFRAAFDRPWAAFADRVVDDMIALESMAVASTELAYTISVRVSGLLADSDGDRVALFRLLKAFYRVRSAIVHGGRLGDSAAKLLQRESELRDVVRATLRGMLNLRESDDFRPTTKFLSTTVDDVVLDSGRRGGLRVAMGTPGWRPASASASVPESRTTRMYTVL